MRQIELSPVEYKALMAFADGGAISRPVRRRLLQAGALKWAVQADGTPCFKLTPSAEASLIENAPRCAWSPEDALKRMKAGDHSAERPRPRMPLAALAIAAMTMGGQR